MVVPEFHWRSDYLVMLVGVIGTTIAPWMQFYLQAAVVEKGVRIADYRYTRYDVVVGCIVAVVVAMFIMVACAATLLSAPASRSRRRKTRPGRWRRWPGEYCAGLFAFGLFNASLFAASVLPLSTAYYVCEGFGWETGIDKRFREAPAILRAVHRAHRARLGVHPHPALPAAGGHVPVAGAQRRAAAVRADLHPAAGQPQRPDGHVRELTHATTSSRGARR